MNRRSTAAKGSQFAPASASHVLCCVGPESADSVKSVLLAAFERQRPGRFDGSRIPVKNAIAELIE